MKFLHNGMWLDENLPRIELVDYDQNNILLIGDECRILTHHHNDGISACKYNGQQKRYYCPHARQAYIESVFFCYSYDLNRCGFVRFPLHVSRDIMRVHNFYRIHKHSVRIEKKDKEWGVINIPNKLSSKDKSIIDEALMTYGGKMFDYIGHAEDLYTEDLEGEPKFGLQIAAVKHHAKFAKLIADYTLSYQLPPEDINCVGDKFRGGLTNKVATRIALIINNHCYGDVIVDFHSGYHDVNCNTVYIPRQL